MVACDYPQCKREWVSALLAMQSLAILTTPYFIVPSRLRRVDGATTISDMVLPGLRATCAEGRDFGVKKERAMMGMPECFVSSLVICIDDLIAHSFVTICFRMCNAVFSSSHSSDILYRQAYICPGPMKI
jgi:hypothetical protein